MNKLHFGFNTAVKGLLASQRSLYITNHNVSNINTKGYTRQEGAQRATTPYDLPGVGFLGTGTEIYDISRIRDSYLDYKYWNENAPMGEWEAKMNYLLEIEKLFGEPSDSSFRKYLDDFFIALTNMSTNPSNPSYREPVRENALAFVKHVNETAVRLEELRRETKVSIENNINKINITANQIASLNRQIYSYETSGYKANDLRDRRDLLVDELSKMVNIKVHESDDGKIRVSIGGVSLVDHVNVSEVKLKATPNSDEIHLEWGNGSPVDLKSGELKGLLDLYSGDGENNTYRGIPYYQNKLNEFAEGFANKFNTKHKEGYGLNGSTGIDFFKFDVNKPASTINLSDEILEDLDNIAAGKAPDDAEDNRNLLELIALREDRGFFDDGVSQGTPDDFIKSIISNLAVGSMQSERMYNSQNIMLKNIQTKRDSVSGVSYDEEMANMVKFQHAYMASAKMISTLDIIMDVTINRLGLVGR